MKTLKQLFNNFRSGIRWNLIEAFGYQALYITHHLCLFSVAGAGLFGLFGTVLSIVFLAILWCNTGLDPAIQSLYQEYAASRSPFRRWLLPQIMLHATLLACIPVLFAYAHAHIAPLFASVFRCCSFDQTTWILIGTLIALESTKKTLRVIAQTAFYNKQTTIIELAGLLLYSGLFWGAYHRGYSITLTLVLVPFVIQSGLSILALSTVVYHAYRALNKQPGAKTLSLSHIVRARAGAYGNQLSHTLFSGNAIITFFAYTMGATQVGVLKLANSIAVVVTSIMERVFGTTSGALLAHLKNASLETKQHAFTVASRRLYQALIITFIVILVNYIPFVRNHPLYTPDGPWAAAYIFLCFVITENFLITYERFFIVEEKSWLLALLNGCCALITYATLHAAQLSLFAQLLVLILARVLIVTIVWMAARKLWGLSLPKKIISTKVLLLACSIASLLLLLTITWDRSSFSNKEKTITPPLSIKRNSI